MSRNFAGSAGCAALLLIGSAGCSTRTEPPAAPAVAPAIQPQSPLAGAIRAQDYVRQSASLALLSIRSAETALERSSNSNVRSVAHHLLKDHTGLSAQLSFAGRRLNLLPSASLLPQHEIMLRELVSSRDFDRTYIAQQRSVASTAYRLHTDYLRAGTSPTLKPVARNALRVISSEMERLRRL